jgi:hypothetical protein
MTLNGLERVETENDRDKTVDIILITSKHWAWVHPLRIQVSHATICAMGSALEVEWNPGGIP